MKRKASPFGSLRWRITLAMLALGALGSAIYAASVYIAAERLERRWVGIDASPVAWRAARERLRAACGLREGADYAVTPGAGRSNQPPSWA